MFNQNVTNNILICVIIGLAIIPLHSHAQFVEEVVPEDAGIIPVLLRDLSDGTMKFAPGTYDMAAQMRFNSNTNITIEGSGSGFGPDATILDFASYSANGDGRALSVRGGVTVKNLTIINVSDRATDLRSGTINAPNGETIIFENVWFINCNLVFKSTGGRTVGTPENPMQVNHCVFAHTADYPFESVNDVVDIRDTTVISFNHCDFFNQPNLLQMIIDDPVGAPNEGATVTVKNSIFYAVDGADDDDFDIQAGTLTLSNNVMWDSGSQGDVQRSGDGTIFEENSVTGDPNYVNVGVDVLTADLDFSLNAGSPASGLGDDGLDAGSIAAEPANVSDWMVK